MKTSPKLNLEKLFSQFLQERKLLQNVTAKTLVFYQTAWNAWKRYLPAQLDEKEFRSDIKEAIMSMMKEVPEGKKRAKTPVSINAYIRAMNAFTAWLKVEGKISTDVKFEELQAQKKVREILTDDEVARLVAYKPTDTVLQRVWMMSMVILDCGLRLDDIRRLKRSDIDFENVLIKVYLGKGRKERLVPFSLELRKILFKYCIANAEDDGALFRTSTGSLLSARNADRDLKTLGKAIGIPKIGFHRMRHTMASNYMKQGGNVVHLQKILGHANIDTTQIYVHLQTKDMVAAQQTLSLLSKRAV
jgi:integrase/recombinase XerD